jgi:hypothetical protein
MRTPGAASWRAAVPAMMSLLAGCLFLVSFVPVAQACGMTDPAAPTPSQRQDVEMETAIGVYIATAGVIAIGAPIAAEMLDETGRFPLLGTLGISLATGFGGMLLALAASAAQRGDAVCGGGAELYPEHVLLFDLIPFALAGAPTLIAWNLSGASTELQEPASRLSLGALADPRRGAALVARLEF